MLSKLQETGKAAKLKVRCSQLCFRVAALPNVLCMLKKFWKDVHVCVPTQI